MNNGRRCIPVIFPEVGGIETPRGAINLILKTVLKQGELRSICANKDIVVVGGQWDPRPRALKAVTSVLVVMI